MEIQFDITVDVSQDFIDHTFYTEDGYRPALQDIVHRVIEDILSMINNSATRSVV